MLDQESTILHHKKTTISGVLLPRCQVYGPIDPEKPPLPPLQERLGNLVMSICYRKGNRGAMGCGLIDWFYPLVNVYITMGKITIF